LLSAKTNNWLSM